MAVRGFFTVQGGLIGDWKPRRIFVRLFRGATLGQYHPECPKKRKHTSLCFGDGQGPVMFFPRLKKGHRNKKKSFSLRHILERIEFPVRLTLPASSHHGWPSRQVDMTLSTDLSRLSCHGLCAHRSRGGNCVQKLKRRSLDWAPGVHQMDHPHGAKSNYTSY